MKIRMFALALVGAFAMSLAAPCHAATATLGMMSFKVLAVPIELPEPASIGVLAVGSALLLFRRRR